MLLSDGGSSMDEMSSMFDAVISRSKSAGREVIRIGGDMTWALDKLLTTEKLPEWEAFYEKYVGPPIIGNIVQENPFYRDPSEVLQELSQNRVSSRP